MRKNAFGEAYCHTADEVRRILDDKGWEVWVSNEAEAEGDEKAVAELSENESGDPVCFVEADTLAQVTAIIRELRLETPG